MPTYYTLSNAAEMAPPSRNNAGIVYVTPNNPNARFGAPGTKQPFGLDADRIGWSDARRPDVAQRTRCSRRVPIVSLNLSVDSGDAVQSGIIRAALARESGSVCFANVHMVIEARQNVAIREAVNGADWTVPDGMPLVWAMRALHGLRQERIAGMDVVATLLSRAADAGVSVFFYGSTPEVLQQVRSTCETNFPALRIAGMVSPPFRPATPEEDDATARQITDSGAGLVFVALGCPKQELWMARMRDRIPAVLLGVGGALPVLAGCQTRAPRWLQQVGMEWLFRLVQEPRRLFKRYAVTNSLYVYCIVSQLLNQRIPHGTRQR